MLPTNYLRTENQVSEHTGQGRDNKTYVPDLIVFSLGVEGKEECLLPLSCSSSPSRILAPLSEIYTCADIRYTRATRSRVPLLLGNGRYWSCQLTNNPLDSLRGVPGTHLAARVIAKNMLLLKIFLSSLLVNSFLQPESLKLYSLDSPC